MCAIDRGVSSVLTTQHAINEHGEHGRHAVHSDLARLGKAYAQFDRLMSDRDFLALVGRITDIPDVLYDPEYVQRRHA